MATVHPSAVVGPRAELASDVVVGPYAIIEGMAVLSKGCVVHAHAVVRGTTRLGARNVVYPFAVIGTPAQLKGDPGADAGAEGRVEAGDDNTFREHVTVHAGTEGRTTRIGSGNLFMVGAHVAHDAVVGSQCVLSNGTQLAGHSVVEDWVTFGGLSGVTQFVRVGESAFVAATAACERDVPPFVIVQGDRARVRGLNLVGLRRRRVPEASIRSLQRVFRLVWCSKVPRSEVLRTLQTEDDPYVCRLVSWLSGN